MGAAESTRRSLGAQPSNGVYGQMLTVDTVIDSSDILVAQHSGPPCAVARVITKERNVARVHNGQSCGTTKLEVMT